MFKTYIKSGRVNLKNIYEWMALLHWYIVPMAYELGFNLEVVKNFALFSNVIEYAMTNVT
jgi:hypothetical protein